jgi:hypothetical protein
LDEVVAGGRIRPPRAITSLLAGTAAAVSIDEVVEGHHPPSATNMDLSKK